MAGRRDIESGRAFIRLFLKDDFTKAFARSVAKLQGNLRTAGESMTRIGRQMAATGIAAAVPFVLAIRTFAGFDDAMRTVKAVSQSTEEQFLKLTETAKQLGRTTSFTAIQVAQLMTELGRAGFVASEIDVMTGAVLNLARATGTDAALAAGIMSATIRQFSLQGKDAARVADALTAAANKSFNTVESLGEALSYAGPVAADFNMSIEETLAILGTLGNVGIQGSNAGTVIRRMLIITGAEAKKLQDIFGVSFVDSAGNARPLVDVLDEVAKATEHLGTAARAEKFNEAFGLLGITGASAIAKNITSTRELLAAIEDAGGVAAKTAQEMDAGIGGSFRILISSIEGVAIAVGETLAPMITEAAKRLQSFMGDIVQFVENNKQLVIAMLGATIAVTALGSALVAMGFAAGAAATALGILTSPLSLIAIALAGITAAVIHFGVGWDHALTFAKNFFENAKGFFINFQENMGVLSAWLKSNWKSLFSDLGSLLVTLGKSWINNFTVVLQTYQRLSFAVFRRIFSFDFLEAVGNGIAKALPMIARFAFNAQKLMSDIMSGRAGLAAGAALAKQFQKDFGFKNGQGQSLTEELHGIIAEGLSKLKIFEGFEFKTEGPKLNLKSPEAAPSPSSDDAQKLIEEQQRAVLQSMKDLQSGTGTGGALTGLLRASGLKMPDFSSFAMPSLPGQQAAATRTSPLGVSVSADAAIAAGFRSANPQQKSLDDIKKSTADTVDHLKNILLEVGRAAAAFIYG